MTKNEADLNTKDRLTKTVIVLAVGEVLRGLIALISQVIIAKEFGTSNILDAFLISLTIPNLIGDFFIGGIIYLSFIPVFTDFKLKNDQKSSNRFIKTLFVLQFYLLAIVTILYWLLIPALIPILAPGFTVDIKNIAFNMFYMVSPLLLVFGLSLFGRAIYHSYKNFKIPIISSLAYPVFIILSVSILGRRMGAYSLAVGAVLGGVAQLIIISGYYFNKNIAGIKRFNFDHPDIIKVVKISFPLLISGIITQVNLIIIRMVATTIIEGGVAVLNYASQVISITFQPMVAIIGTAVFPSLSEESSKDNFVAIKQIFLRSFKIIMFLSIPMTIGIIILRQQIVELIFQRGSFDAVSTVLTGEALFYLSLGIFAMGGNVILGRLFYSLKLMTTVLKVGVVSISLSVATIFILKDTMGINALALAFSIKDISYFVMLVFILNKIFDVFKDRKLHISILKVIAATVVMGCVIWAVKPFVNVILNVIIGTVAFLCSALLLKAEELQEAKLLLKKYYSKG